MLNTIKFNELACMALDFVDAADGFLFLRIAGPETTTGAVWAKLSARSKRRQSKHGSEVYIPGQSDQYPTYVSAQRGVRYRTLRTQLPSGLVDLAMIHPDLTVVENKDGFYILTYEDGVPAGFFNRLNTVLSIPLKPEWEPWLWQESQRSQTWLAIEPKTIYENHKAVQTTELTETACTPISRLPTQTGAVRCYRIQTEGRYKTAWLKIIREHLGLGIRLGLPEAGSFPAAGDDYFYTNGQWTVYTAPAAYAKDNGRWTLQRGDQVVLSQAPSLNWLLSQARDDLGVQLIIEQKGRANNNGQISR